jgi:uncharacterized membrane protein
LGPTDSETGGTLKTAADRKISATLVFALGVTAVALLAGYQVKDLCTRHQWDGYQYRTSCYNDIYALYFFRGLDIRPFPYIHGDGIFDNEVRPDGSRVEAGDLEYPALTGALIGGIAEFTHSGITFFHVTAVSLAFFGFVCLVLLGLIARNHLRLFFFAAAPSLMLYAFHNWDLLAVALMCAGLYAFHRRADGEAGLWLGLGAAAKVFPALIIPALALSRHRDGGRPMRMVGWAVAAFAAVNIPFAIVNRTGWWAPWKFQTNRFPNYETSWFNAFRHLSHHFGNFWSQTYPQMTSYISAGLFIAGAAFLLWRESKRDYPRPYVAALGILLIWLLTAKVYSPQYALWLLPFFVLVEIPWYGFLAFTLTDAAVWFSVSAFFLVQAPANGRIDTGSVDLHLWVLEAMVWVRYAALGTLLWMSRRAGENIGEPVTETSTAPTGASVAPVEWPA